MKVIGLLIINILSKFSNKMKASFLSYPMGILAVVVVVVWLVNATERGIIYHTKTWIPMYIGAQYPVSQYI